MFQSKFLAFDELININYPKIAQKIFRSKFLVFDELININYTRNILFTNGIIRCYLGRDYKILG